MSITELSVHMCCHGCELKIKKALRRLDGVNDIDIDMSTQKVTVMGYVDQETVLKAVRRTGRRAELWPYGYNPSEYTSFNQQSYLYQQQPAYLLRNQPPLPEPSAPPYEDVVVDDGQYYVVDYDRQDRGGSRGSYYDDEDSYYRDYQRRTVYSFADQQPAAAMFSDENPHACLIM
ncbi:Heavy metal-associated isoprenylated plant protein 28 [Linum grandiflorum]